MDKFEQFDDFLKFHQPQLVLSGVPSLFWKTLFHKLRYEIFDAGAVFEIAQIDYEDYEREPTDPVWKLFVSRKSGISAKRCNSIYLVDAAWTYDARDAREHLMTVPGLLNRMCHLMGMKPDTDASERVSFVLREMWRYNQSFSLNSGTIDDRMPLWYIMDEVGSAINHSDEPNFRTVPFFYAKDSTIYTLLFPIVDVYFGDEITRDFVEGQTSNSIMRQALLLPWIKDSLADYGFEQEEPYECYFLAGRISESLPELTNAQCVPRDPNKNLKVFSEYIYVNNYLTDPAFTIVDNKEDADIRWYTTHFKDYKGLSRQWPHVFVNQFPFENVITVKDLLSIVCRRKAAEKLYDPMTLDTYPAWRLSTYNLSTELPQFVSNYEHRNFIGLENHWICKPWNLARGLDTHVTNNLFHILRLPSTGPKIVQKYIARPVLYARPEIGDVKFDIRYVILLRSVKPLRAYAYSNFFLRFANKDFCLSNFDDYEVHFTVMNYSENTRLYHLKCADFILEWAKQYPNYPWKEYIEPKILQVLKEVLEAAVAEEAPKGIAHSPQSRAVYAADLMLEWRRQEKMQPMLLEVNFAPDCKRACEYYPDFYNDIFRCLFLDESLPDKFHTL